MQIIPVSAKQCHTFKQNNIVKKQEVKALLDMTPELKNQLKQRNLSVLNEVITHLQLRMSIFGGYRKYDSPEYVKWLNKLNDAKSAIADIKAGKVMRIVEVVEPKENSYGFIRYDM